MWQYRLAFRDYLRANSDEARRYEVLKRNLAAQFSADREAYTEAKTNYIASVYRKMARPESASADTIRQC